MNFKKRVNGSWTDTPHYIHKTDTDTLTTLPDVVYVNDTTVTVGLKGNMEQIGTPTSSDPIQPQETGERTGNLVTNTNFATNNLYINVATLKSAVDNDSLFVLSLETNIAFVGNSLYLHTDSGNRIVTTLNGTGHVSTTFKLTETDVNNIKSSNSPCFYIYKSGADFSSTSAELHSGYKIPISSANTTTPVYLGEVQSTRQIKQLVLTGEEDITTGSVIGQYSLKMGSVMLPTRFVCSHYPYKPSYQGSGFPYVRQVTSYTTTIIWFELDRSYAEDIPSGLTKFKAYLAQQYANGTPVCVWYVLATPETAVVNEPLRKIGDYADEVSGITIPTIAGANTISVGTTLQPSEVSVNYKGWHPVADVHEAENGQWD